MGMFIAWSARGKSHRPTEVPPYVSARWPSGLSHGATFGPISGPRWLGFGIMMLAWQGCGRAGVAVNRKNREGGSATAQLR